MPHGPLLLTTLNARYTHSALGLRYLQANMGTLERETRLLEFTIQQRPADIVEQLLRHQPRLIGFGIYIWNSVESERVIALIREVAPEIIIVIGGPEVSYEYQQQRLFQLCDHLITGMADLAFSRLCHALMEGEHPPKIHHATVPTLSEVNLPYHLYSDEDIRQRVIYIEASRGCPFRCEFCLSALDRSAWPFPLPSILNAIDQLWLRGARRFKFVDRTFNLNPETTCSILNFFLERLDSETHLHFELIPDHLPPQLRAVIPRFPPGSLQFEVGIQTFHPPSQQLISRRQENEKSCDNLRWLRQQSHALIHADLIAGLPGEDLDTLAAGFDRLVALGPQQIQLGLLKRLRGTPLPRHTEAFRLRFDPAPPYTILATSTLNFQTLQRIGRFARYRDLIANSNHFHHTRPHIDGDRPFNRFMELSDWLFTETGQTHRINLKRLYHLVYRWFTRHPTPEAGHAALQLDFDHSGLNG
ncbi:MAG: DUF4080 domain-containing protein, partial [Gammaproteobacteria bacterium]|nr:DUF4080 domain-containing protein [Gammaproteobacteria bacterium]